MKNSFDSYGLYSISPVSHYTVRARITMKENVDIEALTRAVNIATDRYPYFKVKPEYDDDGGYRLVPNDKPVVVLPTSESTPKLCSREVNEHFLFADCCGRDIYLNISHALAGGKGIQPWVQTCVYQYIVERYGVEPDASSIRKPGSPLLEGENLEPAEDMFREGFTLNRERCKGAFATLFDYISGIINPRGHEYFIFSFDTRDLLSLAKCNDNSVNSLFDVLMFKAMDKVIPARYSKIVAMNACNPCAQFGLPNSRYNILTHVYIPYDRKMAEWDLEKLGTITRGATALQSDELCAATEMIAMMNYCNAIDRQHGIKNKKRYAAKHSLSHGKGSVIGSYIISYSGYADWGEVADYIDSFVFICDGHLMLEISSLGDKIFCAFNQVTGTDKYIRGFEAVLQELGIKYEKKGPFKKNLAEHEL